MSVPTIVLVLAFLIGAISGQYEPNWDSLDARPLPSWFDEAKIGIFIHWGVFSVPSFDSEWFWYFWKNESSKSISDFMIDNYPPHFSYQEFAKDFTAEFFNATQWAELFADAGAKYVVLTTKHHEGFAMWPSEYAYSWNSLDVGPHRDVVGQLGAAVRKADLVYGLYHSLFEWYNPIYLKDKANNFTTQEFVDNKIIPEMKELVNLYEPSIFWSDGSIEADYTYWKATDFIAWLYNESPVKDFVVVNDRWGTNMACQHGGFYTCTDRYDPGTLQPKKWENAMTLDKNSYGFRRNAVLSEFLTPLELLMVLARTVSCGGNLLINVAPSKEGVIHPIFEERLRQLGDWLKVNGDAIYATQPWVYQNDSINSNVWYTSKGSSVYAIDLEWPADNQVELGSVLPLFDTDDVQVHLLGYEPALEWLAYDKTVKIFLPSKALVATEYAWVLWIH